MRNAFRRPFRKILHSDDDVPLITHATIYPPRSGFPLWLIRASRFQYRSATNRNTYYDFPNDRYIIYLCHVYTPIRDARARIEDISSDSNLTRTIRVSCFFRCTEQITVSGVHDIRTKDMSGNKTLRTSLVLRSGPRLQAQELQQKKSNGSVQTRLLGTVPGRKRILLSVSKKIRQQ